VRIWCGLLILGEVSVTLHVSADRPAAKAPLVAESAQRYEKIFPSYSHEDRAIVNHLIAVSQVLGRNRYLQDVLELRAGQHWQPRLRQLIEDADSFQLFWSHNSMHSQHCRDEWEYALALPKPAGFVVPVYWEEPRPEDPGQGLPPATLDALHFAKVPDADPYEAEPEPEPAPPAAAGVSRPPPKSVASAPLYGYSAEPEGRHAAVPARRRRSWLVAALAVLGALLLALVLAFLLAR
jgi:TIR domain